MDTLLVFTRQVSGLSVALLRFSLLPAQLPACDEPALQAHVRRPRHLRLGLQQQLHTTYTHCFTLLHRKLAVSTLVSVFLVTR